MPVVPDHVWKVLLTAEAVNLIEQGTFYGSADDERDGFIHLSAGSQIPGTINRHFAMEKRLILARCEIEPLGDKLRWERSRRGEDFPHLYRPLHLNDINAFIPLPDDPSERAETLERALSATF